MSGFQPLEFNEKGEPIMRRESELPPEKEPRVCGIPRRYLFGVIILVFVVFVAIGLGIGLGIGLKKSSQAYVIPTYGWNLLNPIVDME